MRGTVGMNEGLPATATPTTISRGIFAKGNDADYARDTENDGKCHGPSGDEPKRTGKKGQDDKEGVDAMEVAGILAQVFPAHEPSSPVPHKKEAGDEQNYENCHWNAQNGGKLFGLVLAVFPGGLGGFVRLDLAGYFVFPFLSVQVGGEAADAGKYGHSCSFRTEDYVANIISKKRTLA